MTLGLFRDRFANLDNSAYLVNHSLGAMPVDAKLALERYATEWEERGVRAWSEGWWDAPIVVGDQLASLVGAPPGSIAMVPNATIASAVVASCFRFVEPENRIVISELDFPSTMYLWHNATGAEIRTVRSWDGVTVPTETFLQAIDERTALVAMSHVLFKSAHIQEVTRITEVAHDHGAYMVLDCYQSAGAFPFSLTDLNVDFAVGGSVKWLCGGPGAGWLYVRPDLQHLLRPRLVGWQADLAPFEFRPGPIEYTEGIGRFLSGTPNVPSLYAAGAAYALLAEVGLERVRETSLQATTWIIDLADRLEVPVFSVRTPEERGPTVVLSMENEQEVADRLIEMNVIVDARPGAGIRIGPHFFNNENDLSRLADALAIVTGRTP